MEDTFRQNLLGRERELSKRIAELRQELDPLEKEMREILFVKRALGMPGAAALPMAPNGAAFMTMKQLVVQALRDQFKDGATGKQLVDFFKTAWGRDVARESLSPQLSRLRAAKQIGRSGHVWYLIGADMTKAPIS